ncbi:hypothetical protein G7046_g9453 [Stylonectria norvegica]|nr:hypothetical protein G7046_g9453 [Stylonectria norvegica]
MPLVKDNAVPSISDMQIPYVCTSPYVHDGNWLDYPETQHVTLEHLRYHEFRKYDPSHLASVLQNWLFFGLLRAILPSELAVAIRDLDFIHTDEAGVKTVRFSPVLDLLQRWHALEAHLPADQRRSHFEANAKILSEARPLVFHLSSFPEGKLVSNNLFPVLPRAVAMSCAELGEHLTIASVAILDPAGEFDGMDRLGWGNGAYFLECMEAQGWCPFLIAQVERTCSFKSMLRQSGILSAHGLQIQFPGFLLGQVRADGPLDSHFVVDTSKGEAEEATSGPLPAWRMLYSRDKTDMPWEDIAPSATSGDMAIILFSYGPWRPVSEGILVKVKTEVQDGTLAVSRVCRMLVAGMPEYDSQDWIKEPWKRVTGSWLPPHQIWYVD